LNNRLIAFGILSVSLLTIMAGAAVSPALADIQAKVSGATPTLTKMVLTIPALFIIPTSFLVGRLSISKKRLILFAVTLYTVAGSAAYYATDIYTLLFTRALLGVSVGITMPSVTALIADFYFGHDRFKMMSYNAVTANVGGIIATFMSGFLAAKGWQYAFLVYLTGAPVLLIALLFIKDPIKPQERAKGQKLPSPVFFKAVPAMILFLGFYIIPMNIASYLISKNLGGPMEAGFSLSCSTGTAVIIGMIAPKLREILGRMFIVSATGAAVLSFFILSYSVNMTLVYISMALMGYTLSMMMPFIMHSATEASEGNNIGATSLVTIFIFLGQFISPIFFDGVGKVMGNNDPAFQFKIALTLFSLVFLYSLKLALLPAQRGNLSE